jgi:hypothetical protein
MAQQYAKKQPQGYTNFIENVAIVGVSWSNTLLEQLWLSFAR